jgi:hypothetical protein
MTARASPSASTNSSAGARSSPSAIQTATSRCWSGPDAAREYAYDRQSKIGKLDKPLDEAIAKGWTVVDMKNDWKRIFGFEGTP